jgi:hypothetical protein
LDKVERMEEAMPRIGATAGALVLMALAIGWNLARYPAVWDTIGPLSPHPQAQAPPLSEVAEAGPAWVQPSIQPERTGSLQRYSPQQPADFTVTAAGRALDASGAATLAAEERNEYPEPLSGYHRERDTAPVPAPMPPAPVIASTRWPAENGRPALFAANPLQSETPSKTEPDRRLLPVVYPKDQANTQHSKNSSNKVVRLPPVEKIIATSVERLSPAAGGDPDVVYPRTGM